MLRLEIAGRAIGRVVVASGEELIVGRAPLAADADPKVNSTVVELKGAAKHVSRILFTIEVGNEVARLRFKGSGEAQLASLFDAPAGARRVTVVRGMSVLLDEGENQLVVLRGAEREDGTLTDLLLSIDVTGISDEPLAAPPPQSTGAPDADRTTTAPTLEKDSREWFVALALAEPWLVGRDDYPRPPSNREIYERIVEWNKYAWNLQRPQRVDDCIRPISRLAFGPADDPFTQGEGRSQNVRFAVGRRTAEVRLVSQSDLADVQRKATTRRATEPH